MNSSRKELAGIMALTVSLMTACGVKAGKEEESEQKSGTPLSFGETTVKSQQINVSAGQALNLRYLLGGAALRLSEENGDSSRFEISVLDGEGKEVHYDRSGDGELNIALDAKKDETLTVLIRDNAGNDSVMEASQGEAMVDNNAKDSTVHRDVTLKAFVTFARQCKQVTADGSSTATFDAPAGSYYVQPFVFLGKVGEDQKVSLLADATVTLSHGNASMTLKRLADMDLENFREMSGLSKDDHILYTRAFYNQYFGAAGEMYTVDTFRKQGDCAAAPVLALGSDPGLAEVKLKVADASLSPNLDEEIVIRPTVQPPFSIYLTEDQKMADWTQCTYDPITGAPKTYNGDASTCKTLSVAQPPFVKLDYKMPSQVSSYGVTTASDPTRVIFYGHARAKEAVDAIIAQASELAAADNAELSLAGCLTNGGLVGVPLTEDKAFMPLAEMNVQVGDIVNLARRPGSYTGLTKFYQGNLNLSGSMSIPTCLPGASGACDSFKTVTFHLNDCRIKGDSGVAVGAIGDSFAYPDYFDLSGIITE